MSEKDRLFIIDDDASIRRYLADTGRRLGYQVASAGNRADVERKLPTFRPAVILLDLQMPDCDGIRMLKLIRDVDSDARVILINGTDERMIDTANSIGDVFDLNMGGTLQKPVLTDTLRRELRRARDPRNDIDVDELREAIESRAIVPVYQPKAARDSSGRWAITEVEALAHWQRDDSVAIMPREFVPVAERAGLLPKLSRSFLCQVASQLRKWEQRDLHMKAAVNICPSLLNESDFPDQVDALVCKLGLDNSRLTFELTESSIMRNAEIAMEILSKLRVKGFGLSIDDYGTGYSSLEQLYRMPVNELKIDRFLVRDINTRMDAATIVEAIILLAHKLKLSVCAEGVESQDALAFLLEAGCDRFQGPYVGKAMSADALEKRAREFGARGFDSPARRHEQHVTDDPKPGRVDRPQQVPL